MSYYKSFSYKYKKEIKNGECYCILSGLKIENLQDLSLEHFCPKSRVSYELARLPQNIYPAFKIVNNVKGNLLACEWKQNREFLLQKAIRKAHNQHQKKILQDALDNVPFYNVDYCKFCVLYNMCEREQKTR